MTVNIETEGGGDTERTYQQFRRLALFDGIPNEDLWGAIQSGHLDRRRLERDEFIDAGAVDAGERVFFVLEGQVAVAVFEPSVLEHRVEEHAAYLKMDDAERKELSALKPPPLAREARKNLALFCEGDLFNASAIRSQGGQGLAAYTVAPTTVASVSHAAIAELAVRYGFFELRMRRAIELARDRLRNIAGVKQEILDFFIRQGVSISGEMVRVRQLDRCIDCKQCEIACEERYGVKRLTLGGYQLGMLDFVFTCRTCTDQRCIDPCEYDSISFNKDLREVVINEASCVGCTLCAQACPYAAIEMVNVEDPKEHAYNEDFKLRLDEDGNLDFGPGKPRIARARRIANKCDHCMAYGDQACVSACPTGSLIEVSAYDLFHERTEEAVQLAKAGYDQDPTHEGHEILPVEPFTQGIGVSNSGLAKTRRGSLIPLLMWGLGLGGFLLCAVEVLLRLYLPTFSLQYVLLMGEGREALEAARDVVFRPGGELALWCGYIGTGLMAMAAIYPMWRRVPIFRRFASNTMWFDFHIMSGIVGPLYIILHSALKLDNWVASAFWSMIIVVISGVVGRYLYTKVPDLLNGRELEELDHQRAFNGMRKLHGRAVAEMEAVLQNHRLRCIRVADHYGLLRSFLWILSEDLKRPFRWVRRRMRLKAVGAPRGMRGDLAIRTARMVVIERRRVLVPRAQLLLHSWKKVHVPFTFLMTVLSGLHIWIAWQISM